MRLTAGLGMCSIFLLVFSCLGAIGAAEVSASRWVRLGPDLGAINAIAVDPARPNIVYAADNSQIFISRDGGWQWAQLEDSPISVITVLAVDPSDAETIYVGSYSAGIFKRHHLSH